MDDIDAGCQRVVTHFHFTNMPNRVLRTLMRFPFRLCEPGIAAGSKAAVIVCFVGWGVGGREGACWKRCRVEKKNLNALLDLDV